MASTAYERRQRKGERKPVRIKVKKDDLVRVIAGRDKGKTGKVLEVDRFKRKVLVEGVMLVKRHTRRNPSQQVQGGIAEKPMPIDISNVMVLTSGGIPTRIGFKLEPGAGGKQRRVRIARKGGETLERK